MNTSATDKTRRVILAGATGWAGSALARGIAATGDLQLVGAVARGQAGQTLGAALALPAAQGASKAVISANAQEALRTPCDVFVEYTKPDTAKANVMAALLAGAHVVVGTSGLTDEDYREIDVVARAAGRGVLACGNFAITAVLLQKFALMAARYVDHYEVIDYAKDAKVDAPSGTVRELANRLGAVRSPAQTVPVEQVKGPAGVRGATIQGVQVHALRLPGFVLGAEVIFGMKDQRLHIKHEAGASAEPYVAGGLLAIRKVDTLVGVSRGLDTVMDL